MKREWIKAELITSNICETESDTYKLDKLPVDESGFNVCGCGNPKHHWNGNGYGHSISNGNGHTDKTKY